MYNQFIKSTCKGVIMLYVKNGHVLEIGQKIRVYRNLHTGTFSIQDLKTRIVIAHGDGFILHDVDFKVYKKGQERVRNTLQKRVHAYVIGTYSDEECNLTSEYSPIFYDPYKTDYFVDLKSLNPIHKSDLCLCLNNRCYIK